MITDSPIIQRALISVSDKSGLVDFAQGLSEYGIQVYSTGGTRQYLLANGIEVQDITNYTQFPEMMGGRIKTLHPKIFGGILARLDLAADITAMKEHDILGFELVVVNLYPFEETIAKPGVLREEAIEQIDIGGPSLIRAAAKNHRFVTVATSPDQYSKIMVEIKDQRRTSLGLRKRLAAECFAKTAVYDQRISEFFQKEDAPSEFPQKLHLTMEMHSALRYGENPHQKAAVYRVPGLTSMSLVDAKQLHGKDLSFNNLLDLDSALSMVRCFPNPAAVVIKHNNPCGAAMSHKLSLACQKGLAGDPLSAFGAVIGFNTTVDGPTAEILSEPGLFIEAIVAPNFDDEAIHVLTTKPKWRDNVRLMQVGAWAPAERELNYRFIQGGMLAQESDNLPPSPLQWKTVTQVAVADELWEDVSFAWEMVRHVKSNAIVLARDAALVGVGAGQMSRVDSVEIAIEKAAERSHGSILASDAFFPFPDSIERAAAAGIIAVIQPGGSRRDDEVIEACNRHRIPMIFTGRRHFKH